MKRHRFFLAWSACLLIVLSACSRTRSDPAITADVEARIHADAALAAAPVNVQSNHGVVVLSGSVPTDVARISAENSARQVAGVQGVVNNLQVAAAASTPPEVQPAAPPPIAEEPAAKSKTGAMKTVPGKSVKPARPAAPAEAPPKAAQQAEAAPPQPVPPAAPAQVTIPEGTGMTIRLIDPVDTGKNKEGDTFHASLDEPIVMEEKTIIPKNADVLAQLVSAKSAGHFTGASSVVLVVTSITVGGKTYPVKTGELSKQGASRGKRSAAVIGGGAAVGALIGAIAGGGKGAAIGAAAGAGTGTGVQGLTKGEQIKLPAETLLDFQLSAPLTVIPAGENVKREKIG